VIFRVGEIGNPRLKIEKKSIKLIEQVGFGGAVLLVARRPGFLSPLVTNPWRNARICSRGSRPSTMA
jgi:hypothetical protein